MSFKQLYAPPAGEPIFAAGARLLIAGFSRVGGAWNPPLCAPVTLREPWIPGQSAIFSAESAYDVVVRLEGDIVRTTTITDGTATREVAAIMREGRSTDAMGMRMYLLTSDIRGTGQDCMDFIAQHRLSQPPRQGHLCNAVFFRQYSDHLRKLNDEMTELRRQVTLRHHGFCH